MCAVGDNLPSRRLPSWWNHVVDLQLTPATLQCQTMAEYLHIYSHRVARCARRVLYVVANHILHTIECTSIAIVFLRKYSACCANVYLPATVPSSEKLYNSNYQPSQNPWVDAYHHYCRPCPLSILSTALTHLIWLLPLPWPLVPSGFSGGSVGSMDDVLVAHCVRRVPEWSWFVDVALVRSCDSRLRAVVLALCRWLWLSLTFLGAIQFDTRRKQGRHGHSEPAGVSERRRARRGASEAVMNRQDEGSISDRIFSHPHRPHHHYHHNLAQKRMTSTSMCRADTGPGGNGGSEDGLRGRGQSRPNESWQWHSTPWDTKLEGVQRAARAASRSEPAC
jgi:hypothetical protein